MIKRLVTIRELKKQQHFDGESPQWGGGGGGWAESNFHVFFTFNVKNNWLTDKCKI